MDFDSRVKAYKFVAYSAVTFSLVSVLSVMITLPILYNYASAVRRQLSHDIYYCQVWTDWTDIWNNRTINALGFIGWNSEGSRGSQEFTIPRITQSNSTTSWVGIFSNLFVSQWLNIIMLSYSSIVIICIMPMFKFKNTILLTF